MSKNFITGLIAIIFGLIGLILVTFKLSGMVDWSWWWVTFPLWIIPAMVLFTTTLLITVNFLNRAVNQ